MQIFRILSIMLMGFMLQIAFIGNASIGNTSENETHKKIRKHGKKTHSSEKVKKKHTDKKKEKKRQHIKKTEHSKQSTEHSKQSEEYRKKITRNPKAHKENRESYVKKNVAKPKTTTNPPKPQRSWLSRMTGSSTATTGVAAGALAASTTAATTTNRTSYAISAQDREKAAQDTSWKKNEQEIHKFHEGSYHELVNTQKLRDAKEKNGWHWIKLEHGKQGYSFYNPKCGWMYKINTTGEWYQPCKKKFMKQLNFDL